MHPRFFFSPDDSSSSPSSELLKVLTGSDKAVPSTPKRKRVSINPTTDEGWGALGKELNDYWKQNTWLTLQYTTQPAYELIEVAYNKELTARQIAGGDLSSDTATTGQIELLIDEGLKILKKAIDIKFKKTSKAQYSRYGIVKLNRTYIFPYDREEKLKSLELLINALTIDKLNCDIYDLNFWKKIKTDFAASIEAGDTTDDTISTKVSSKDTLKKDIKKVAKSIRLIIEGNFPETFKAELRRAGWKKEEF